MFVRQLPQAQHQNTEVQEGGEISEPMEDAVQENDPLHVNEELKEHVDIEDEDTPQSEEWSELYQDEKVREITQALFNKFDREGFDYNEIVDPNSKYEKLRKLDDQKLLDQIHKEQGKAKKAHWHFFHDYIVKRSNDLGLDGIKNFIKPDLMRRLSRREQTDPMNWCDLPKSAEASDNSL